MTITTSHLTRECETLRFLKYILAATLVAASIALYSGLAALPFASPAVSAEKTNVRCKDIKSMGYAWLSDDGTIFMHLRSPGSIMESDLRYEGTNPKYESIKQHLGEMKLGERTNVLPWCDSD
jgi:hypothetical protein